MAIVPKLYDYQLAGLAFLGDAKRAILADEMGLGKTAQAIQAAVESGAEKVLVISPNSLKWVWAEEAVKWAYDVEPEDIEVYNGKTVKCDKWMTVINIEAVRLERNLAALKAAKWDVIIVDEAHRIKNRKAAQTKAVKQLTAEHIFLLTGTPILNTPDEMWSLLNYLYPKTYSSYWRFFERYVIWWDNGFGRQISGYRDLDHLAGEIADIMLRRTKAEVIKELPPKTYQTIKVDLLPEQRKMYNAMRDEFIAQLNDDQAVAALSAISQLTRLKQIATDPHIVAEDCETDVPSAKMDALNELLGDLLSNPERKVVVFSQWARACRRVASATEKIGVGYATLTGDDCETARKEAVHRFQSDPECRVFISTIQAGGVGITLTAADTVIFLDKLWTPAYNQQAEDRVYARMNDLHGATIYSLVAKDTIEERIEDMLLDKEQVIEAVMCDGSRLLA